MSKISRRDILKLSGATLGAAALGSTLNGCGTAQAATDPAQMNSLLASLSPQNLGTETRMKVRRGIVSSYAWPQTVINAYASPKTPSYWKYDSTTGLPTGDPMAQLDPTATVIDPTLYNAR